MVLTVEMFFWVLFQITLFILFSIKALGVIHSYVIPALSRMKQDAQRRWCTLREQRLVATELKKQLASQFLKQEKQIALLAAKLAAWHSSWEEKELARQATREQRAREIIARREKQLQKSCQRAAIIEGGLRVITEIETQARAAATAHGKDRFDEVLSRLEHEKRRRS